MQLTLDPEVPSVKVEPLSIDIDSHRQIVGWFGLLLPLLLFVAAALRPTKNLDTWLNSLSAYYYTSGSGVLAGMLAVLALCLLTYRGYPNKYEWADRWGARVAGVAAGIIALCPTYPPEGVAAPLWWTEKAGQIHDGASAVMLTMFAVFSLCLFRLTDQRKQDVPRDKQRRNRVYLLCGLAIVGSLVWVVSLLRSGNPRILFPESVAIGAFAVSWLVKGYAHRSVLRGAKAVARAVTGAPMTTPR